MDTSETYMKMCEKAEEIQRSKIKPMHEVASGEWGDIFAENGIPFVINRDCWIDLNKFIWLPRQDQLQEMFSKDWRKVVSFLMASAKNLDCSKVETMEQLCLIAIMRDKFQKLWNGEDWILSPIWTVVVTRLEGKHEVE